MTAPDGHSYLSPDAQDAFAANESEWRRAYSRRLTTNGMHYSESRSRRLPSPRVCDSTTSNSGLHERLLLPSGLEGKDEAADRLPRSCFGRTADNVLRGPLDDD